jgi:hypothetical protein
LIVELALEYYCLSQSLLFLRHVLYRNTINYIMSATEAAGEPCKEAEKKETVLGKALKSSVFAFSLDETRAKEGYDAEGVRKLLPLGGNYRLPEVWRTMKLWTLE